MYAVREQSLFSSIAEISLERIFISRSVSPLFKFKFYFEIDKNRLRLFLFFTLSLSLFFLINYNTYIFQLICKMTYYQPYAMNNFASKNVKIAKQESPIHSAKSFFFLNMIYFFQFRFIFFYYCFYFFYVYMFSETRFTVKVKGNIDICWKGNFNLFINPVMNFTRRLYSKIMNSLLCWTDKIGPTLCVYSVTIQATTEEYYMNMFVGFLVGTVLCLNFWFPLWQPRSHIDARKSVSAADRREELV